MTRTARYQTILTVLALVLLGLGLLPSPSAAQYYAFFGKNKIQYRDLKWKIYHSPHFDVYYHTDKEELLQKVISFAESAYDELSREFDYQIQNPISLIFYETHSAFEQNNVIQNFIPEGIGAFATSVRNRMFMPVDLPDPELMELMLHELTHIFQYHIIFGGRLGKGVSAQAPLWFMEGMASFMEGEESARDKMFVRDAVVNDQIPPITQANVGGFFAYRFGYSVFEFIVERWGKDGFRDFLLEFRNTLGGRVGKAVERTFQMSPEDFDAEFRRWLRRRYLAELLETGEPADFGRLFRADPIRSSAETSPVASPSGDLVAAFTTVKGDVDVVIFDTQQRALLRNLTKGLTSEYQYFVAQELTMGRKAGRDLTFSPDGNTVALFARKNRGRVLLLVNVLKGGIRREISMTEIEQQLSPAFSPDGRKIAFSGWQNGWFDIFEIDLETREITNITNDEIFDAAPVYTPDGQSMVVTSVVGGYSKLFRIDLDNPSQRIQIREGIRSKTNETDAVFSPNGRRLYFTSDGTGANNVFSIDLQTGAVQQHTNSITGAYQPTVLASPDGDDRIVFTSYWKGKFDLYRLDVEDPITEPIEVTDQQIEEAESERLDELPRFEPSIEVTLDERNKEKYGGFRFYLEDVYGGTIGISDDSTFIAQIGVSFANYLGDRRILALFQSVASFRNFDVFYTDQTNRLQWQVHVFDDEDFFVGLDRSTGRLERGNVLFAQTGARGSLIYPLNVNHRLEAGLGYIFREIGFQDFLRDPDTGFPIIDPELGAIPIIVPRKDDYPEVTASFVGDTAVFAPWGGITGRRYRIWGSYAPDQDQSGTLTASVGIDVRQYLRVTRRSNFAFRVWGAQSNGNFPNPWAIGGLDTLRGFRFRSLVGDRAFFGNLEYRFPLIDVLAVPLLVLQNIRGNIFLDIGGAYYKDFQGSFRCYNSDLSQLQDCVSSYGWGFSMRLFGLNLNWDFSKRWDFDKTLSSGFDTSFWIGSRF